MAQRTLARYLTEEQRNKGIITADLKFLIEIVSRACQAISIAIGKGGLGGGKRGHFSEDFYTGGALHPVHARHHGADAAHGLYDAGLFDQDPPKDVRRDAEPAHPLFRHA